MDISVAMLTFPDVMKKAQEEIDRVVGSDRMPEFHDKDRLPYVLAVINETLRFVSRSSLNPHSFV